MSEDDKIKVKIYHSYYGCDTGCCGHTVEIEGHGISEEEFRFGHPGNSKEDAIYFTEDVIRKQWPQYLDRIDWDSIDYSKMKDYIDC